VVKQYYKNLREQQVISIKLPARWKKINTSASTLGEHQEKNRQQTYVWDLCGDAVKKWLLFSLFLKPYFTASCLRTFDRI
jgi:hypothetical protein